MSLIVDDTIVAKLRDKHQVDVSEVYECFANISLGFLEATDPAHKTSPEITYWFIEGTDRGRPLLVAFVNTDDGCRLKTAFEPSETQKKTYCKLATG